MCTDAQDTNRGILTTILFTSGGSIGLYGPKHATALHADSKERFMKAIAIIPARLASTRLPRKMLREIAGKPLIGVVYEAVRSSPLLARVLIATDSEEIMSVCRQYGWEARMTSAAHRSGTERVHEI